MSELYDIVAINTSTWKVRILDRGKTMPNAEAIVNMAVMRRGGGDEIFSETRAGSYKDGEIWDGYR